MPDGNHLKIEYRALDALRPAPSNARTHSRKQVRQIAASVRALGFANPLLVDETGTVIAGHGRLEAARSLGLEQVPVIVLGHLSEAGKRALALADNRIALGAGWNLEILAQELTFLSEVQIDFAVEITGFETAEIDLLIDGAKPKESSAADRLPAEPETAPVTRPGDLWRLGRHRLLCADARAAESYARLMEGEPAQLVFTDPPYNVPVDGHVCGLGRIRHAEFAMAAGEMSEQEFTAFLTEVLGHLARHSAEGSIHYLCVDWRHIFELQSAAREAYTEIKNLCVWNKTNAGMGSLYRSKHELVLVCKKGKAPHINNIELGKHGRYRTNVWDYAGINSFGAERLEELALHPTVKPIALVADALLDCSKRGGLVLDAFAGSGTTLIAAEKTGRRAYALELEPRYVETAIRRWEAYTGDHAIHAETGLTLAELAEERSESFMPNPEVFVQASSLQASITQASTGVSHVG
jgi:DNA modification methylase